MIIDRKILPALCLLICFTGCLPKKNRESVWMIVDVDSKLGSSNFNGDYSNNCFLSIMKNGQYVFFLNGYFSEGKTERKEKEIRMYRDEDSRLVAAFDIKSEDADAATLEFSKFDTSLIQKTRNSDEVAHSVELPLNLLGNGLQLDIEKAERTTKADPYTPENNRWRHKAVHKENDREIRDRIRNHVQFMQAYFENAMELNVTYVYEANLASPFEIYSNGVAVRKFED